MPSTALDFQIFRDIFTTHEMREVFSDEFSHRIAISRSRRRWRGCRGGSGSFRRKPPTKLSPSAASRTSISRSSSSRPSASAIRSSAWCSRSSPLRQGLRRMVPLGCDDAGHHRHCGDHADSRRARPCRGRDREDRRGARGLATRYRDTPMAGRSNLQQAVPITFGFKAASLLAAFQRHRQRLKELRPRVLVGEFAGAAGTLSSLGARRAESAGSS